MGNSFKNLKYSPQKMEKIIIYFTLRIYFILKNHIFLLLNVLKIISSNKIKKFCNKYIIRFRDGGLKSNPPT